MSALSPIANGMPADALLHETFALVLHLRQGASVLNLDQLRARCRAQVDGMRLALVEADLDERSIDHICLAQCALLDEAILGRTQEEIHAKWASETLQASYFNSHQAGELLYEQIRTVLREPAANPHVLVVFHRVLMLGFLGRYRDGDDPQRQHLIEALAARVAPLRVDQPVVTQFVRRSHRFGGFWLLTPALHTLAAVALMAGLWWGLDYALVGADGAYVQGQGDPR